MSEELEVSSISARGELHRVTRTIKRYLKWQQANGAIGSVPAPAAERAAFDATQKAREQAKLEKLKAGLRGPKPSAPAGGPPRPPARPQAPSSAPPPAAPAEPGAPTPSIASRFAEKAPSTNQPAPDIQGASKSSPWKTLGSRPARRFQNNAGAQDTTASTPEHTQSAPQQRSAPAPAQEPSSSPSNPQLSSPQRSPAASQVKTPQSAPVEEDIYLMDYDEEMEIPADYNPREMLYDAPPTPRQPAQAPAKKSVKDPATMSKSEKLEFLKSYMGDCRRCGLCEGRQNVVFGAGNPDARLVFVADAPGATDDEAGAFFDRASVAGTPDELLAKMVAAMGLSLEEVYLCTVVKCRPPGDRRPQSDEVKECQPFLFKQLGVTEPEVIVALGGFATMAMSAEDPSLKPARGQWQSWRNTPLMPTYHPRDLIASQGRKQAELKGATWQDLQSVMAKLGLK